MQEEPIGVGAFSRAETAVEDARDQAQALREVLFIHPETLTFDELVRVMDHRVDRVRGTGSGRASGPRTDRGRSIPSAYGR